MAGDIPEVNWASYSLASKYQMMRAGPGSAAVAPAARTLGVLAPAFSESSDVIQAALRGTGVEWQGQAATAFAAKMSQATEWAQHSGRTSKAGGDQVQSYATSYNTTRNKIPSPVEVGENSFLGKVADGAGRALDDSFGSTFGVQSDYAKRVAANQAADAVANQALTEHVTLTRQAVASFPDTQPVPPVSTATATLHGGTAHGGVGHGGAAPGVGGGGAGTGDPAGGGAGGGRAGGAGGPRGGNGRLPEPTPTHSAGWTPVGPPPGIGAGGGPGALPGAADGGGAGWAGQAGPASAGGGWDGSGPRGGAGLGCGGSGLSSGLGGTGSGGPGGGGFGGSGVGGIGGGSGLAPRGGPGFGGYVGGGIGGGGSGLAGRPPMAGAGGFGGAGPGGTGGPGAGLGGMSPMGGFGGGAGVGDSDHEHRNNVFIPSDEPFVVDEGDDVVPPVLGVPGGQW